MSMRLKARVDAQGRLVLPAALRHEVGLEQGGEVTLDLDEDGLRLTTSRLALRRLQKEIRNYVPEDVSLADELIAERRAEAARENDE